MDKIGENNMKVYPSTPATPFSPQVETPVSKRKLYARVFDFLFYFVGFSSIWILYDRWQGRTVDVVVACELGLFYAVGMVFIVPLLPWHREEPFTTRAKLP